MTEIKTIEQAMKASLSPSDAPAVYALTSTPESVANELDLDGKLGYRAIKRAFDIISSGLGLIVLSPVIAGTALAVKLTSPGPIIFKQKRVGQDKKLFDIYKFRTMRIDTPDLPTHKINASDWLTPVGPMIRKYSLDELPQLLNILKGDMSVIGPRPALWSQFDLIAERDAYGANNVRPGLTGWAQINGRDELTIERKSALDGNYVRMRSVLFDLKCFFKTFSKLSGSEVTEGSASDNEESKSTVINE